MLRAWLMCVMLLAGAGKAHAEGDEIELHFPKEWQLEKFRLNIGLERFALDVKEKGYRLIIYPGEWKNVWRIEEQRVRILPLKYPVRIIRETYGQEGLTPLFVVWGKNGASCIVLKSMQTPS